ncbi:MAG: HDOD domain-containing protein [Rubrivivax sp.]
MSSASLERSQSLLTSAPCSLEVWAQLFDPAQLPVLGRTAFEFEDWRANEEQADAHLLSEFVSRDPLMTLKLFHHLARMRPGREESIPETVTGCLLMLGIPPFFTQFAQLLTVEEHLEPNPAAFQGLMDVLKRSRRAADFALGFAVHRMDHDAQLIHSATLLHDVAEMLLWLKAPALAAEIARRQALDPRLRSVDAQKLVLQVSLPQLQKDLMARWHLPDALAALMDSGTAASSAQARNVELATRLARHTQISWDNPAIPDDLRDIADFLQIGLEPARHLVTEIDS